MVINLRKCSFLTVCPRCALRHPYSGKRILKRPHKKKFYESGIENHDRILLHYKEVTINNNLVIINNQTNNFRIFYGSWSTDKERYNSTYAFSTEAKEIKSFRTSDNLRLIPEKNPQIQNISWNKNFKLNIIPNFKNNDLANITNDSTYSNLTRRPS